MEKQDYYIGLDIGTNSVGWAATNTSYDLLKFKGDPMWGVHLFDEASPSSERRAFRTARRRLDRRQQRVSLVQEIFAHEIESVDPRFFIRIQESALYRNADDFEFPLFNDPDYTDKDYFAKYPTIHHLLCDLMESKEPHDVRLVYLACAWLVSHRGHFLNTVNKENIAGVTDFREVYEAFENFFTDNGYSLPWSGIDPAKIEMVLSNERGVSRKQRALKDLLFEGKTPSKNEDDPFGREAVMKLICGGKVDAKALLNDDSFSEAGSISLSDDDEKIAEFAVQLDERADIIPVLKAIYDWSVLTTSLQGETSISAAKVKVWEQHKKDLKDLKGFIRKYLPEKYNEIFRSENSELSYSSYAAHSDKSLNVKKISITAFSDYLKKIVKDVVPDNEDKGFYENMCERLESYSFLPKQKNTDNRVIPYQLYWYEMKLLLDNAVSYLPFLKDEENGISNVEKLLSIMEFRIPYFVGPLNCHSDFSWIERKSEGRIYPWNFNEKVDLDASEKSFIVRMTNYCTYYPGEKVLPKDSLTYHRFMVLNTINPLTIDGRHISVELKQAVYTELFQKKKNVSKKDIVNYFIANGIILPDQAALVSGVDDKIAADLKPYHIFKNLLKDHVLREYDVERIIERAAYTEDKSRLMKWVHTEYPKLTEDDVKYICRQKIRDFGRLSYKFLNGLEGVNKETGECCTVLKALWDTNDNLMQILSDKYTFSDELNRIRKEYYAANPKKLEERLNDMYLSPAVRRAIFRALTLTREVVSCCGHAPKKIFVETTREIGDDKKGQRTRSRRQQIQDLYKSVQEDTTRFAAELNGKTDNELRIDRLFLYFMQLGKCAYSGQPIDIADVWGNTYNIEHIYPQSLVKDDSVLNNLVLVRSEDNGAKSDSYPVDSAIQQRMNAYWTMLKKYGLMTDEKYKRLTRTTGFTKEEKEGFINRQLVETSQSTKAVITLLKEYYPNTEIIYAKAGLVSSYRQQFGLLKSRSFNDLHHAKDAYLNIVVGNVYHTKFTRRWFNIDKKYSIKPETVFTHELKIGNDTIWRGPADIAKIKSIVVKNNAHLTVYAYTKKGGLFDQQPVKKGPGLVPRKAGLPPEMYGGYNKKSIAAFLLVKYAIKGKYDLMLLPVELMKASSVFIDENSAKSYAEKKLRELINKPVEKISLPIGIRKIKINTVFSFDGFRMIVGGVSSGAKTLIMKPIISLTAPHDIELYIQKLDSAFKKQANSKSYTIIENPDGINHEFNVQIYDFYTDKLQKAPYNKRPNNPVDVLISGRTLFMNAELSDQVKCLLQIGQLFGRMSAGCDLTLIGGKGHSAATISFGTKASLWKKAYTDVRIIDCDASGLHERLSQNLLNLL